MVAFTRNSNELVINDENFHLFARDGEVGDHIKARGLIPRDYEAQPYGMGAAPFDPKEIPIIPRDQWSGLIKQKIADQSQLSDIRLRADNGKMMDALDQNGQGYCWAYSTGGAIMLARAVANEQFVRLSPHGVACKIKNFRDQGGWGALSLDFAMKTGYPSEKVWPQKSMSRQYDNDATWADAANYKVVEAWADLSVSAYDRKINFDALMSCLLQNIPVVGDFNWWGHSVCLMDAVEVNPALALTDINRWGIRLLNSWTNGWSDRGMGIIVGRKAVADGAVACRYALAA